MNINDWNTKQAVLYKNMTYVVLRIIYYNWEEIVH